MKDSSESVLFTKRVGDWETALCSRLLTVSLCSHYRKHEECLHHSIEITGPGRRAFPRLMIFRAVPPLLYNLYDL